AGSIDRLPRPIHVEHRAPASGRAQEGRERMRRRWCDLSLMRSSGRGLFPALYRPLAQMLEPLGYAGKEVTIVLSKAKYVAEQFLADAQAWRPIDAYGEQPRSPFVALEFSERTQTNDTGAIPMAPHVAQMGMKTVAVLTGELLAEFHHDQPRGDHVEIKPA